MAAPHVPPITIPDTFTVWAATDLHGQLGAVDRLLAEAGLAVDGAWIAPPGTALVVTGDMVDRGPDSLGLVRRLAGLRAQAAVAGSIVALLEGNHEVQVLGGLAGVPELFRALMAFGGPATFASQGLVPREWIDRPAADIAARVDALAPDLRPTLWSFAPYARWRDVVLVHGGPVPHQPLDAWGRSAERLWIRTAFFASADAFPAAAAWASFREAGIGRVVFGHTPVERPTTFHDGRALNLDTWRGNIVSLARLARDGDLGASRFLAAPTEPRSIPDAPVTGDDIRRFDTGLPAIVDAWIASGEGVPRP
jgi:diadenosine tetraphosphatase ApaH/serine/threonine PP2A family protein phosphatase